VTPGPAPDERIISNPGRGRAPGLRLPLENNLIATGSDAARERRALTRE
jgi:hypothetical protein